MSTEKQKMSKSAQRKIENPFIVRNKKDFKPLAIWLLPQLIGGVIAAALYGDALDAGAVKINAYSVIISAILMVIAYHERISADFKRLFKNRRTLGYTAGVTFLAVLMNLSTSTLLKMLFGKVSDNQDLLQESAASALIPTLTMTIIAAPICEEFVFRYMLGTIFKNNGLFYIFSAALFGAVHVGLNITSVQVIPYVILGLCMAILYRKTDNNIASSITLHFFNNLLTSIGIILALFGIF